MAQCTHEPFKSVRELGLTKTEIKVKTTILFEVNLRGNKNIKYFLL